MAHEQDLFPSAQELVERILKLSDELRQTTAASRREIATSIEALRLKPGQLLGLPRLIE